MLRPTAALAMLLVACHPTEERCPCIPDDQPQDEWAQPSEPTCGEELCAVVQASYDNEFVLANPEALDCALMALRDRSPGIVRWTWSEEYGQYSNTGYVLVQPEGTAVHRSWGAEDLSWVVDDALAGELPSAQYYDDCLAETDPRVRFDCLRDVEIADPTVCNAGWYSSSI